MLADEITFEHVSTIKMAADILTKSLRENKHITCMQQLGMCSTSSPAIMPSHPIHTLMTFVSPPISTLHSSHYVEATLLLVLIVLNFMILGV